MTALIGVELCGWKRRKEIERMQGSFVKMVLGLARNTSDYLWKLEALLVEEWRCERWPKVCLREEIRGIINGNPSR